MKRAIAASALALVMLAAHGAAAQPAAPEEEADGVEWAAKLSSEVVIRKLYADFEAAWNAHDAVAMAAFWAADGDHYEPDGRMAEGRKAIETMFAKEQAGPFRDSTVTLAVRSVWMITPRVALVNGTYGVSGVHDREGKEIALRQGLLTSVLLHENGRWWIAASRAMIPIPLPYR